MPADTHTHTRERTHSHTVHFADITNYMESLFSTSDKFINIDYVQCQKYNFINVYINMNIYVYNKYKSAVHIYKVMYT